MTHLGKGNDYRVSLILSTQVFTIVKLKALILYNEIHLELKQPAGLTIKTSEIKFEA